MSKNYEKARFLFHIKRPQVGRSLLEVVMQEEDGHFLWISWNNLLFVTLSYTTDNIGVALSVSTVFQCMTLNFM